MNVTTFGQRTHSLRGAGRVVECVRPYQHDGRHRGFLAGSFELMRRGSPNAVGGTQSVEVRW